MHLGVYQAFLSPLSIKDGEGGRGVRPISLLKEPEKEENCNLCLCSSNGLQLIHSTGVHRMQQYRAP